MQYTFQNVVDMPCTADDLLQAFAASVTKILQSSTHMGPPQGDTSFTILMQIDSEYEGMQKLLPSTDAAGTDGASSEHSGFWSRVSDRDPEASALQPAPEPHSHLSIKSPHTLMKIISAGTMSMQVSGYRAPASGAAASSARQ